MAEKPAQLLAGLVSGRAWLAWLLPFVIWHGVSRWFSSSGDNVSTATSCIYEKPSAVRLRSVRILPGFKIRKRRHRRRQLRFGSTALQEEAYAGRLAKPPCRAARARRLEKSIARSCFLGPDRLHGLMARCLVCTGVHVICIRSRHGSFEKSGKSEVAEKFSYVIKQRTGTHQHAMLIMNRSVRNQRAFGALEKTCADRRLAIQASRNSFATIRTSSSLLAGCLLAVGYLIISGMNGPTESPAGLSDPLLRPDGPGLAVSSLVTASATGAYAGARCRTAHSPGVYCRKVDPCWNAAAGLRKLHRRRRLGGYAGRWRPCSLPHPETCNLGGTSLWRYYDIGDKHRDGDMPSVMDEIYSFTYAEKCDIGGYFVIDFEGFHGDLTVVVELFKLGEIFVPGVYALIVMFDEILPLPCNEDAFSAGPTTGPPGFVLPRRALHCAVATCTSRPASPAEVVFASSRRIGEADNPGPFSVGGAASSGQAMVRNDELGRGQPSWKLEGHGRWRRTHGQAVTAEAMVAERWPIPVICRDVNHFHQSETRLMHHDDIVPFLEDELYGLEWSREHLESVLEGIYASGRGVLDPAVLVPSDSWLHDCDQYGWADVVPPPARPYSFAAPVSTPKPVNILEQYLESIQKRDPEAALARVLMQDARGTQRLEPGPQVISLEQLVEPPLGECVPIRVNAAPPPQPRSCRRARKAANNPSFPGLAAIQAAAVQEASPSKERVKQAKSNLLDCVILNSSGRPQLMAALEVSGGASVIVAQEHHSHGASFIDLQHDARALGWTLLGAPATRTQAEGTSAGVCVAVKQGIGVGDVAGTFDLSPPATPGRLSGVWVHAGPDSGMLILSVYLFHTEGASMRNKALLRRALSVAASYGSPWLIAGDFNCEPDFVLSHWADALERANAYIVATAEPTHRPSAGAHRTLDFAICSHHVNDWVLDTQVDLGFEAAPHRAVRLRIRAEPGNYLVQQRAKPRHIPKERPIGCSRKPLVPVWYSVAANDPTADPGGYAGSFSATTDLGGYAGSHDTSLWPSLIHAVEGELCRLHDLVDAHGHAKSAYCGRGKHVTTTQKLALPRKTSAALGKTCIAAHALVWLSRRVKELADMSAKVAAGLRVAVGASRHWSSIMAKLSTVSGLPSIIDRISPAWAGRMEDVRCHIPGRDTLKLREIQQLAFCTARDMKKAHLHGRMESWRAFARKQVLTGAAIAHRLTKRDHLPCCDTGTSGSGKARTASPQAIVDNDLVAWREVWCRLGNQPSAPWRECEVQVTMPSISAADVLRAARTFPKGTSIGCDDVPPSALADLSEPLRDALACLLNHLERRGSWPSETATSLIHLIPKPSGGRRPIGVLPTLVRIWERIRKCEVQKWTSATRRHYDWATQGRSAEAAAWTQSLFDEAAAADGLQTATVFLDLAKAFETIRLELVWQAGVRFGFPLDLLRMTLEAFAFERRLTYQSAISAPTDTLSAVLAGGGMAQVSMLLVLMRPLDRLWDGFQNRGLSLCAYVDDVALHFAGTAAGVASVAAQAAEQLVQTLEGELSMVVSRRQPWASEGPGKTVATASRGVATGFLTTMRRLGIIVQKKAKHLGVHFGPGGRTRDLPGKASRWAAATQRRVRAARLGRRLGGHVVRTGIQPSVLYGSSVALPNLGVTRGLRRLAARVIGPTSGRSVTARLAVGRCDPALQAVKATMYAWFRAVWDCEHLHGSMARAWLFAQSAVAMSKRPSMSAGGAASSFIAALSRVGWRSPSYHSVITRDGTTVDLLAVAPRTTLQYLVDDYSVVASAASDVVSRLNGGAGSHGGGYAQWHTSDDRYVKQNGRCIPWFEPAAAVLNSKWAKEQAPEAVASVGAALEGGWWPQERLFQANLAADPFCRACCTHVGTFFHRCMECSARKEQREAFCPESLQVAARTNSHDPLYAQGVPRRPVCPPAPAEREYNVGQLPAHGSLAAGHAYTDGAMRGAFSRAKRAGWAFVVQNGALPFWGKYGSIGDVYPSALRAELRALLEVLRHTAGGVTIHVDNQEVVDGISRGQGWCCASSREGADLWRRIWQILPEVTGVVVVKVKAHLSFARVLDGAITCQDWAGNAIADVWAKAGGDIANQASSCDWVHDQWTRTIAWYRWLVRLASQWVVDTARSGPCPNLLHPVPTARRSVEDITATHELWRNFERAWCRKCGITAKWVAGRPPVSFRRVCRGTMGERCSLAGRQFAVPPLSGPSDDGAISFDVLLAKGAVKVAQSNAGMPAGHQPVAGGYAETGAVATASRHSPLLVASEDTGATTDLGSASTEPSAGRVGGKGGGSQAPSVAHASHKLRRTKQVVWCAVCGRHAAIRLGTGLLQRCRGHADGAYPARLRRLKEGRHPISGDVI